MNDQRSGFQVHRIETTPIAVIVQTASNRIRAQIHLRENERIKDALNTSDDFIAFTGAKVFDQPGLTLLYETPFLAINRSNLIWVMEDGGNIGASGG